MNQGYGRFASAVRAAKVTCSGVALAATVSGCQAFGGQPNGSAAALDAAVDAGYMDCYAGGACQPDNGSRPTDCSVASGLETLPVITFDDANTLTGFYKAEGLYAYTDNSTAIWFDNGSHLCSAGPLSPDPSTGMLPTGDTSCGFEPWTARADLCRSGDYALHLVGGPFLGWGGGIGISMQKLNGQLGTGDIDANKALCVPADGGAPNPVCPPAGSEFAVRVAALDVSAYSGVSFWARRGPKSQAGVRVNIGDKHTDDDLNYLAARHSAQTGVPEPLYCQRVKECGCLYQLPCTYYDDRGEFWCRDPHDLKTIAQCGGTLTQHGDLTLSSAVTLNGSTTNCNCGAADVCNKPYAAFPNDAPIGSDGKAITAVDPRMGKPVVADTAFYGRACTPYMYPDGSGTSFCFNPGVDPPPAPGTERCGDHWATSVNLGPDWQFYRIPFTDLRQQGFAKKSETLDLHSVSVVRFTWDAGYIDYWIDEVSFYKDPQSG